MRVTINKSIAKGRIIAPPSKSYAHRLLIAAALSDGRTVVNNVVLSKDILATINCLKTLGKHVEYIDNKIIISKEKDINQLNNELVFDCNESGSTLRFFIPIALTTGKKVIFKGTQRLIERGIGPYEEICSKQNIEVIKDMTSITFNGKLKSGDFNVPGNISSQFITGLLFATPLLENDSKITITTTLESKNYIDITLDVLKKTNITIVNDNNAFLIKGSQQYHVSELTVEGDHSNAAFLDSFNYLGGNVVIDGLVNDSLQGDRVYKECFEKLNKGFAKIDISNCIDLGPILFCFAALKHGGHFVNTSRLKIKESNRVEDVAIELNKFGVKVTDLGNEVLIDNSILHKPIVELNGRNDHRIVMALSVMLSVFGGTINGTKAVEKSYPNFFSDLKTIGIEVEDENGQ